jgi:hypothetical protein
MSPITGIEDHDHDESKHAVSLAHRSASVSWGRVFCIIALVPDFSKNAERAVLIQQSTVQ